MDPLTQGVGNIEGCRRALSDRAAFDANPRFLCHVFKDARYTAFKTLQLIGLDRAQIQQHGGAGGNRIDAFTPLDEADIVGGFGLLRHFETGDFVDDIAHGVNGARGAKRAPTMAAVACEGDFKAGTANAGIADLIHPMAFYRQYGINLTLPFVQEGTNPAEVSQTLFPHVGGKDDASRWQRIEPAKPLGHTEHARHRDTIVADTRAVEAVWGAPHIQGCALGKDRVDVGGNQGGRAVTMAFEHPRDVEYVIDLNIVQADGPHSCFRISGPLSFVESRSWDAAQVQGFFDHLVEGLGKPIKTVFDGKRCF